MKGKRIILFIICLSLIFTSGCWDKVELNERAFVSAIVVEANENYKKDNNSGGNDPYCEDKAKRLRVVFGILDPSKLKEGKALVAEAVEAVDVPDAMEKLGQVISRRPFYGQTRTLIFRTNLMEDEKLFREVLDEFERKAVIDRNMKVVVLSDEIEKFVEVKPKLEPFLGAVIGGILNNSNVLSNTLDSTLNDMLVASRNGDGNFAIPVVRIKSEKYNDISIDQLALIKDYKLLKILDTKYIKTYKLINGKMKNGRKLVKYKDIIVPYYIFTADRRIWLEGSGENLRYRIRVTTEGDIEQFSREREIFNPKVIDEVKAEIEASLKAEIEDTIRYFQNDIGVDYLGIGEYTNKYNHRVYEKYKDNWDETFKKAKFDIDVECDIRRIGTVKK